MNIRRAAILAGVGLALVAGVTIGWTARGRRIGKVVTAGQVQASALNVTATAALSQGVQHAQAAKGVDPALQAAHTKVDAARARLKVDADQRSAGAVRPAGAVAAAEPVVERDQDQLIQALTAENGLLREQNADLVAAQASTREAAEGFQREIASLQTTLNATRTPVRNWGLGAAYGTSQTMGVVGERDLGPVRVGALVARRMLPAGNATVDAVAFAVWRF